MQRKFVNTKVWFVVWLFGCLMLCVIWNGCKSVVSAAEYDDPSVADMEETAVVIPVKEIDLGDYQSEMNVGEKQLLNITVLPENATYHDITYSSEHTDVAAINSMGRIQAVGVGTSVITVTCEGIVNQFTLNVVQKENVSVRDIDLGDYQKEMEVGSSQIFSVTIIPEEASTQKVTYESNNPKVAAVNEIGRIEGISKGKATIVVQCGDVKKTVSLKVVEKKSDEIPVTDIEIGDYEEELEVNKTMTLSVTVLPADATNNTVTYKSSDEKIATVKSSGEVKGISEGDVTITVSAGKVSKKVPLHVKTATSRIELNTTYLVLQQGESYVLKATVYPKEADQKVQFESLNTDIISVSRGGVVSAKKCGTGTVLVKNSDTSTALMVIVNTGNTEADIVKKKEEPVGTTEKYDNVVTSTDYPLIPSEMLRYFYSSGTVLTIYGTDYTMRIDGRKIRNYDNEFHTDLRIKKEVQGVSFELNEGENLCGTVLLFFNDSTIKGKYVYLYNDAKRKYELLKTSDFSNLELDTPGKYLLTEQKLSTGRIKTAVWIAAGILLVILLGVYVGVKKQYWFW